jgi:hypothetical protein
VNAPAEVLLALAWPAVAAIGVIAALAIGLLVFAFWRQPAAIAELGATMLDAEVIVRFVGVLVIIPAIFGLGVVDKISGGEAITAISAIAGYVLGHAESRRRQTPADGH